MKLNMKHVLFTDASRATLDGPDNWGRGWVFKGDNNHIRLRRRQWSVGLTIWAGIIDSTVVDPIRVTDDV